MSSYRPSELIPAHFYTIPNYAEEAMYGSDALTLPDLTNHFERTGFEYTSGSVGPRQCGHCGQWHCSGGTCQRVKAIEYHQDGSVKRIEYYAPA